MHPSGDRDRFPCTTPPIYFPVLHRRDERCLLRHWLGRTNAAWLSPTSPPQPRSRALVPSLWLSLSLLSLLWLPDARASGGWRPADGQAQGAVPARAADAAGAERDVRCGAPRAGLRRRLHRQDRLAQGPGERRPVTASRRRPAPPRRGLGRPAVARAGIRPLHDQAPVRPSPARPSPARPGQGRSWRVCESAAQRCRRSGGQPRPVTSSAYVSGPRTVMAMSAADAAWWPSRREPPVLAARARARCSPSPPGLPTA